ncbi:SHOCT domain-containing protein [Terrabacter sp. 2RAF25]|uniref:SHOCT domain-containing protein n=1 Tax=Terrabacter sp. 2RAF25 TaxID=3232998 RepID=UPI003F983BB8
MRGRRGRPGLLGLAARTAVVAGTANAVSGAMQHNQQARAQAAAPPPMAAPVAAPVVAPVAAPAAPTTEDLLGALERLGVLRAQGILTDDEFAQQKTRILAG